jgi:hypothetical protein
MGVGFRGGDAAQAASGRLKPLKGTTSLVRFIARVGRCESIELAADTGQLINRGSFGSRGGCFDKAGNLKRGGSLERDEPTSVSGDTLWGSGNQGLRAGIVAKPVRGGGVNASPRRRGGDPWRGRKPKRASASEPLNQRSGGTDPRGEQSPEVGLPQFGPRNTAISVSVRSPSGGRAHPGRAPSGVVPWTRQSFGIVVEADHPASA